MHRSRIACAIATLSALIISSGVAHADLRYFLNASVAERCAVSEIDAEAWSEGVLRLQAQCNAERYTLRLVAGDELLPLGEVQSSGAADVRIRSDRVWVTQARPGTLSFEIHVDDPFAITRQGLSVRIDAA